jgi:hypothetical protein
MVAEKSHERLAVRISGRWDFGPDGVTEEASHARM